jgi:N-acetylglucosaminyldiphosphoundecaprenol N-acetyl-beta-D-mannosaminyltransferase
MLALDAHPGERRGIDGWHVNVQNAASLVDELLARLSGSCSSFMVCTLNLDHLVKLRRNLDFRKAYARAEYITADGFPIVSLARLAGHQIDQTAGSDFIRPICHAATQHHLPIFLFGSMLSTLSAAATRLLADNPGLDIRGACAPPRGFDPKSDLAEKVIELIQNSGARICFVALGAPTQEIFSAGAVERTSEICFLPIGAGLDFIAGTQVRAPRILQRAKLEWAWRLMLDPIRLAKRYALCALIFGELVLRHCRTARKDGVAQVPT